MGWGPFPKLGRWMGGLNGYSGDTCILLVVLGSTGTEYTTVTVDRNTVRSPQFYADFFGALKRKQEEKS